jgi:PLP dependent protein
VLIHSLAIPNLYAVQTITSAKAASGLNKHLSADRPPLNVLLQVNTSGEDNKSGVPPLTSPSTVDDAHAELTQLARFIVAECPRLHLQGLMTIGSLAESLAAGEKPNEDFARLVATRDRLQAALVDAFAQDDKAGGRWGIDGRLLLSMGMSSDFEAALTAGSDVVRVGTGIFGSRPKKEHTAPAS